MAAFFPIANHWINVDRITSIDFDPPASHELVCKILFDGSFFRLAEHTAERGRPD